MRRPYAATLASLAALLLMLTSTSRAQEILFTRFQLPNGINVILHQDRRLPLVSVNLWYYVGSKDEPKGRSGFAHLFEHLMFMGTEKVPYPQFDVIMETSGGSNNATTSNDRTNYFETGPSSLLETFLLLEADRMAALGTSMTFEKLEAQRKVVRNERRQSYENRPYGKMYLEIPARIFPPEHPYHHTVIGSHEDLERATVDDVKEFFRRYYVPRNASLAIAGDFDLAEARRLVEKHFGPLPAGEPVDHVKTAPSPELKSEARATLKDAVELSLSAYVWHSPAAYAAGDAEMDVLASVLGGGKSSRLYKSLVHEKQLAQEIEVYQQSQQLGSELTILAYVREGASQEALEAEIDRELEKLLADGPTVREVERARNRIETMFWQGLEGLRERADLLNRYQFQYGDPGALQRDLARYAAVTPERARDWARKVLKKDARLVLRVVPAEGR